MKKSLIFLTIFLTFATAFSQKDIAGLYTNTKDSILLKPDFTFSLILKDNFSFEMPDMFKVIGKWKYENDTLILFQEKIILNVHKGQLVDKYKFLEDTVSILAANSSKGIFSIYNKQYSLFDTGEKKTVLKYDKDSQLHGEIKSYYKTGQEYCSQQWSHGKKVGTWKYFDKNQKLIKTEKYVDNKLLTN